MLPAGNRVRRSEEFGVTVRAGRRIGGRLIVVHHLPGSPEEPGFSSPPRVGFVVSKAVGGSVVRHRVARRLRAQVSARLDRFPGGTATVVRALPASSAADSAQLGAALDRALAAMGSPGGPR